MPPNSRQWIIASAALIAASISGVWWHRHTATAANQVTITDSSNLARILKEPNQVRRLHLLANWVAAHEAVEIAAVIGKSHDENRGTLVWLLSAKIAEQNPKESPEQIQQRIGALLSIADGENPDASSPPETPSLKNELLAQARTDVTATLTRLGSLRMHPNDRDAIACAILAQEAETDPQRALQLLKGRTDISRSAALKAIALAWTEKDPAAALAWTLGLPASKNRDDLSAEVLESWAGKDLAAALETATAPGSAFSKRFDYTIKNLLTRWLTESPEESAEWLNKQSNPSPVVIWAAAETLSKSHPLLVADLLARHMPYDQQYNRMPDLVSGWMQKNPTECVAWIRSRPVNSLFMEAASTAASSLAAKDPAAAMAFVASLPGDAYLGYIIDNTASSMQSPQTALNWLLSLPVDSVREKTFVDVLGRMDFAKPQDALTLLSRMPAGPTQNALYVSVAREWLAKDSQGAASWLATLQNPETLLAVVKTVGYDWSQSDPQGAAAFATRLGAGPAYEHLVPKAAASWAEKDSAAAAAWAVGLTDSPGARQAVHWALEKLALYNIEDASRLVAAIPPTDSRHEDAFIWTLITASKTNPETGARVLTTLGTPAEQAKWANRVASDWSRQSLPAATQWATSLPVGPVRDDAIRGLAENTAKQNPQQALALAEQVTLPIQKDNIVASAISVWYQKNPQAALAALEDSPYLTPDRKQKLKKIFLGR